MALDEMVNSANETGKEYATKGKANAALALGIIGTGLGALTGGNLSGLFGGASGRQSECVDKDMFYQTTMAQNDKIWSVVADNLKTQGETNLALCQRMGNMEASIAVANTANEYQNQIGAMRAAYETQLLDAKFENALCKATCNVVRGVPMVSPNQIGVGFAADTRVLDSHSVYSERSGRTSECAGFRTNFAF